ncbi:serine/threonine protein kinase [Streptomyces sp. KhCrAH-43]|uniref:serine/threonine-protein kinase n=1 Tax=unclassified Streptomyces TaxID=2593676 RepID=UPI00037A754A|nr:MULTISPECIES: serine/threonine-protein kinase [unclassified Streptomyces]MYS34386.1 protein kinase [Streptomyces sp. SID4920]MYX64575.1 protein kinase [Streptomyces sp. SID8373]RAJ51105.1 serine/threonine protein kinase [Streptomyces sp. KhCrAH-43]
MVQGGTPSFEAGVPARVIAGRYRLHTPIGAGGMGEVWQAYDERLDRRVAVKMMLAESPVPPGFQGAAFEETLQTRRARFLREVQITAGIEHLGVPAIYDTGTDEASGRLFVVMQLLQGRELQTFIDETDYESETVSVSWAAAVGAQIASVLDTVHRHDVVHRDIKPSNLMLTPGGVVKVLDFGVAALRGVGTLPRLTQVGMTVGTPPYMSPEQSLANAVGPAADVYALACVLHELLTGKPPFTPDDSRSHMWHHVHTPPPPVRTLRADVPAEIEKLLLAMLTKEAEQRMDAMAVYDTLLPFVHASTGTAATTNEGMLDPRLPFLRPFGGREPSPSVSASYTPTVVVPSPWAPSVVGASQGPATDPAALTEQEADAVSNRAAGLAQQGQFTQAADALAEAIARAADLELREGMEFSLAQVRFLAGSHREALALFEPLAHKYTDRYGDQDEQAQLCWYYAGQCRMELGEATAAIQAFDRIGEITPDDGDEDAVNRHLDALARLMSLYAATESLHQALDIGERLRSETSRLRGSDWPGLRQIDTYLRRLRQDLG